MCVITGHRLGAVGGEIGLASIAYRDELHTAIGAHEHDETVRRVVAIIGIGVADLAVIGDPPFVGIGATLFPIGGAAIGEMILHPFVAVSDITALDGDVIAIGANRHRIGVIHVIQ